jgi:hypothetical protein
MPESKIKISKEKLTEFFERNHIASLSLFDSLGL